VSPQSPAYTYDYSVEDGHSGNAFSKQENRDGQSTSGSYQVALPDGRVQTVTYSADDAGYVAEVAYEGEAQYPPEQEYRKAASPAPYSAPAQPAYKPAQPAYKPAQAAYKPAQPAYKPAQPAYKPAKAAYKPSAYQS